MDIAILKALEFIDRHLCDEFSLDDIAGIAGYSSFHFARKLKEETGKTVMDHVRENVFLRRRVS